MITNLKGCVILTLSPVDGVKSELLLTQLIRCS
jgi:hypothetical protein